MADVRTQLRWLSQRGNPVGAEELIERIEAELADDPLVVVTQRREVRAMTTTTRPPRIDQPSRYRGPLWGVAAFVAVLAGAVLYLVFAGDGEEVADTPTTVAPATTVASTTPATGGAEPETMTDGAVIQTGVNALYGGDGDRAAELFELPDRTDDQIREEAAYQATVDGRLSLQCNPDDAPGEFTCVTPYHNALTDAVGHVDSGDTISAVVEDGEITAFAFPEHTFLLASMGSFLTMDGRFDGYHECVFDAPFPQSCGTIQMENLDAWADWADALEAEDVVEFALTAWFGGDCPAARYLSFLDHEGCSTQDTLSQTIEYESILGADVSVESCEELTAGDGEVAISCEVRYSNAMNSAVDTPPAVTPMDFDVFLAAGLVEAPGGGAWHEGQYPEDAGLRESFSAFAQDGDISEEYAEASCAARRTPACAELIMDNLDDWAAWYETNG